MAYASEVINLAKSELGYLEKATNSNLYSKTGNAGNGNYTKYAYELDAISGFYNGKKNGYSWCDVFVDWLFVKCFGVEKAKSLLCQPSNSLGAGCTYSAMYYRNKGQFYSYPKIGDQIFFGARGNEYHTGIVYNVDSSRVYTIEGNTSGASGVIANGGGVCQKSYLLTYYNISGYGRPAYDAELTTKKKEDEKVMIELDVLRKGSNKRGQVLALQALINQFGKANIEVDGIFGSKTDAAVRNYQKSRGLPVDGIVGKQTWTQLLIK